MDYYDGSRRQYLAAIAEAIPNGEAELGKEWELDVGLRELPEWIA
jgi:hypothetical protein